MTDTNTIIANSPSLVIPGPQNPPAPSGPGSDSTSTGMLPPASPAAATATAPTTILGAAGAVGTDLLTLSENGITSPLGMTPLGMLQTEFNQGDMLYQAASGAISGGAAGAKKAANAATKSLSSNTLFGIKISTWWDLALVILGAILVIKALMDAASKTDTGATIIEATKSTIKDAAVAAAMG